MESPISFRAIRPADEGFLLRLFASTRPDVAVSNLGPQEKQQFLEMQFRAQTTHYEAKFSQADFLIVLAGKTAVGRISVDRSGDELRVIDIALLPQFRGQGIGTRLISDILAESQLTGKPVRLHVKKVDRRAIEFYGRLGFVKVGEIPTHQLMEWVPTRP